MVELTPTFLFVLLNVVIATIFFVSSFTTPSRRPQLTRASSFLSRVTSFGPIGPIDSTQHNSGTTIPLARTPSLLSRVSSFNFSGLKQAQDPSAGPPAMPDSSSFRLSGFNQAQQPSAGAPVMSDSPSCSMDQPNKDLPLMEHQEEKCEGEGTSEVASGSSMGSKMTWFKSDKGVDAKADDFINKFKNQLKLQRLDSLLRYRNSVN